MCLLKQTEACHCCVCDNFISKPSSIPWTDAVENMDNVDKRLETLVGYGLTNNLGSEIQIMSMFALFLSTLFAILVAKFVDGSRSITK